MSEVVRKVYVHKYGRSQKLPVPLGARVLAARLGEGMDTGRVLVILDYDLAAPPVSCIKIRVVESLLSEATCTRDRCRLVTSFPDDELYVYEVMGRRSSEAFLYAELRLGKNELHLPSKARVHAMCPIRVLNGKYVLVYRADSRRRHDAYFAYFNEDDAGSAEISDMHRLVETGRLADFSSVAPSGHVLFIDGHLC